MGGEGKGREWSYYQSDQVSVWLGMKRDIRTLICSCGMSAKVQCSTLHAREGGFNHVNVDMLGPLPSCHVSLTSKPWWTEPPGGWKLFP